MLLPCAIAFLISVRCVNHSRLALGRAPVKAMRLFTYRLKHDTGFAPNPFHGVCTMATCKAGMRRTKRVRDWIAGFTSVSLNGDAVGQERLVFLMEVSQKLGLDEYYRSPEFAAKIPRWHALRCVERTGDTIYYLEDGRMKQVANPSHGLENMEDDTSGEFALIGRRFYCFGSQPRVVPPELRPDVPSGVANYGVFCSEQNRGHGAFTRRLDRLDARRERIAGEADRSTDRDPACPGASPEARFHVRRIQVRGSRGPRRSRGSGGRRASSRRAMRSCPRPAAAARGSRTAPPDRRTRRRSRPRTTSWARLG